MHYYKPIVVIKKEEVQKVLLQINKTIARAKKGKSTDLITSLQRIKISFQLLLRSGVRKEKNADRIAASQRVRRSSQGLSKSSFIDERKFIELNSLYSRLLLILNTRELQRNKKKEVSKLAFELPDGIVLYSNKDRIAGESDLYGLPDTEKEEEYLFLKLRNRETKQMKTRWYKIAGLLDSTSDNIKETIVPIILGTNSTYEILEASVYHYPPEKLVSKKGTPFSLEDFTTAARINLIVKRYLLDIPGFSIDYRVINFDGIYAVKGITLDDLRRNSSKLLKRLKGKQRNNLFLVRRKDFVTFFRGLGFNASFKAR